MAASPVTVSVTPSSVAATPGGTATVTVQAAIPSGETVGAWTVDVQYDASALTATACTGSSGSICRADYQSGDVRLTGANAAGLTGTVSLASITFQIAASDSSGSSPLTVVVDTLADAEGNNLLATTTGASNTGTGGTTPGSSSTGTSTPATGAGSTGAPTTSTGSAPSTPTGVQGSAPGAAGVTPAAAHFSDVPAGFWAASYIDALVSAHVVNGFPDGTFRPNDPLSRAQLVKMLVIALHVPPSSASLSFTDVKPGQWYTPYVAAAVHAGIAKGLSATTFGPNQTVTREEMATFLARALQLRAGGPVTFKDKAQIDAWALPGVEAAVSAGFINGFPNGTFRPLDPTTRAQAAKVVAMAMQHQASKPSTP